MVPPRQNRNGGSCRPLFRVTTMKSLLSLTVNGRQRDDGVAGNLLLVDYLREVVGLTGTKIGCDGGECGLCTVLVDGKAQHSCLTLAASCAGKTVETIEALSGG